MAQEQPANFACPNYPFCAITAPAALPENPHTALYLAQRQALNQPLVADVPGVAEWYQALHAVSFNPKQFLPLIILVDNFLMIGNFMSRSFILATSRHGT